MKDDWFERASARVKELDRNPDRKVQVLAYIANKKIRNHQHTSPNATIESIYISAPTDARYVITLFEDIYLLIDIYGATIQTTPPFVTLGETTPFPTLDAAVAAAIMGYDRLMDNPNLRVHHNLQRIQERFRLLTKRQQEFVSTADKSPKKGN